MFWSLHLKLKWPRSGLVWTSIREGVYAEAFDILIDWYPSKKVVKLPADGEIAFTSRAELAEATARLLVGQGFEREIVLLTTQGTIRPKDIVDIINETTGRQVEFELVTEEVYLHAASEDQRDKPREWYEQLAAWWKAFSQGDARSTHPLMRDVLGREPMTPREAIKSLLSKNRDYSYT